MVAVEPDTVTESELLLMLSPLRTSFTLVLSSYPISLSRLVNISDVSTDVIADTVEADVSPEPAGLSELSFDDEELPDVFCPDDTVLFVVVETSVEPLSVAVLELSALLHPVISMADISAAVIIFLYLIIVTPFCEGL